MIDIDQKVLSAKIRLSKMVHTGFVAEVQGGEKRLVNRGDFFEEFSIRPVRTGMSLESNHCPVSCINPPRAYGDEPAMYDLVNRRRLSAPCVRG